MHPCGNLEKNYKFALPNQLLFKGTNLPKYLEKIGSVSANCKHFARINGTIFHIGAVAHLESIFFSRYTWTDNR